MTEFEYLRWCENNSNINVEEKENIKWLIWKRRNPILCDKEDVAYPINPAELIDDPAQLYNVYCWLSLNHDKYYIYRVVLEPYDLDEEKETFVFVTTTKCSNHNDIAYIGEQYLMVVIPKCNLKQPFCKLNVKRNEVCLWLISLDEEAMVECIAAVIR